MEAVLASMMTRIVGDPASNEARARRYAVLAALLLSLSCVSPGGFAQINKCNIGGKIVYTDQACPEDSTRPLQLVPLNTTTSRVPESGTADAEAASYRSSKWFDDHRGYAQALEISRQQNAPIFIYSYTDWCGYCKRLKSNMFSDAGVKAALAGFVKVRINPEHSAADERLFKGWGGRGYPTLFIQSGPDSAPARTSGPFRQQNGKWKMMRKADFIAMLESRL